MRNKKAVYHQRSVNIRTNAKQVNAIQYDVTQKRDVFSAPCSDGNVESITDYFWHINAFDNIRCT